MAQEDVWCGAEKVTNMEATEGRGWVREEKDPLKGKMQSSVRKHGRTRTFQGFLLSFVLIELPKVVAIQVQE